MKFSCCKKFRLSFIRIDFNFIIKIFAHSPKEEIMVFFSLLLCDFITCVIRSEIFYKSFPFLGSRKREPARKHVVFVCFHFEVEKRFFFCGIFVRNFISIAVRNIFVMNRNSVLAGKYKNQRKNNNF